MVFQGDAARPGFLVRLGSRAYSMSTPCLLRDAREFLVLLPGVLSLLLLALGSCLFLLVVLHLRLSFYKSFVWSLGFGGLVEQGQEFPAPVITD